MFHSCVTCHWACVILLWNHLPFTQLMSHCIRWRASVWSNLLYVPSICPYDRYEYRIDWTVWCVVLNRFTYSYLCLCEFISSAFHRFVLYAIISHVHLWTFQIAEVYCFRKFQPHGFKRIRGWGNINSNSDLKVDPQRQTGKWIITYLIIVRVIQNNLLKTQYSPRQGEALGSWNGSSSENAPDNNPAEVCACI